MTKKDVVFLLLPSALFAALAGLALFYANAITPSPLQQQMTERNITELARKAQEGEFGPRPDRLVGLLSTSWRARDLLHGTLARFHAQQSRELACGILLGVALQLYVVFRVRAGLRKSNGSGR